MKFNLIIGFNVFYTHLRCLARFSTQNYTTFTHCVPYTSPIIAKYFYFAKNPRKEKNGH